MSTPAEKQELSEVAESEEMPVLEPSEVSRYHSFTMRVAYLSMDRADIAEATKVLARHMQHPTEYAWGKLKRLGRYLAGKLRVAIKFKTAEVVQHDKGILRFRPCRGSTYQA